MESRWKQINYVYPKFAYQTSDARRPFGGGSLIHSKSSRYLPVDNAAEVRRQQTQLDGLFDWRKNSEGVRERQFAVSGPASQTLRQIIEEKHKEKGEKIRFEREDQSQKKLKQAIQKEKQEEKRRQSKEAEEEKAREDLELKERVQRNTVRKQEETDRVQAEELGNQACSGERPVKRPRNVFSRQIKKLV